MSMKSEINILPEDRFEEVGKEEREKEKKEQEKCFLWEKIEEETGLRICI